MLFQVGHDASVSVAQGNGNGQPVSLDSLRTKFLPFLAAIWVNTNSIVVGGHTLTPMMFKVNPKNDGIKLESLGRLEANEQKKEQGGMSAMKRFQSLDRHAKVVSEEVSSCSRKF